MVRIASGIVEEADRAHVRLAEFVAALSLGVDLGFGQPMEHVLRQCLIALRLGERLGLDDLERAVVYYTALLVGVGCHTDAHEQAKWFGDDFALKALKYEYKMPSLSGAIANLKLIGSTETPLSRFRVLLELAIGGYRDLNGMIEYHARMARMLAVVHAAPPSSSHPAPSALSTSVGSAIARSSHRCQTVLPASDTGPSYDLSSVRSRWDWSAIGPRCQPFVPYLLALC
jgi:hypothetical protein